MSNASMKEAINRAGGPSALARALGISQAAISQWRQVPYSRVLTVENITGVSRYELRPDIYGQEPQSPV